MKHIVRIGAIAGAAMLLSAIVTGVAVATTTATHAITLCADSKGNLSYPGSGKTCTSKQTVVQVASDSDVVSLASRLDTAETTIATQNQTIAGLEQAIAAQHDLLPGRLYVTTTASPNNDFYLSLMGFNLAPGAPVHELYDFFDGPQDQVRAVVASDGTVNLGPELDVCDFVNLRFTATDKWGIKITSNVITKGVGCY
jgi:hypothetical protein